MNRFERFARITDAEILRKDLKKTSVRGAIFTGIGGGLDFGLRLASTLILARLLVPEHFGLIGMVTAVTGFAERLSSMGLSTATIQTAEITYDQCSNLFWINASGGCVLGLSLCAFASSISSFYHDERLIAITCAISTNFLWKGITVQHVALLHRQMKQPQIAANQFVSAFLGACVAVGLAINGQGYWALVWRDVVSGLIYAIGIWILCPWVPGMPRRGTKIGRLLRFGRDMTFTQILVAISLHIDNLLLGKFVGPITLGFYRQAYNLMMVPIEQLEGPIWTVSQSGLSRLQADPQRYAHYYQQILFVVSLVTVPLGVFVSIYADEIVFVMLGQKWMEAAIFLKIFGVGAAIQPSAATTGLVLVTRGNTQRYFWLIFANSIIIVVLMAIAIPWGAVGICLAKVSATLLLLFPRLYYSFNFKSSPINIKQFFAAVWGPLVATMVMAGILKLQLNINSGSFGNRFLSLIIGFCLAIIVYLSVLVVLPGRRGQLKLFIANIKSVLMRSSVRVKTI